MRKLSTGKGFTLVELLVVIGIIALLIAILMPALNRAREQARSIQCLSNIKQLGTAFIMYTNAYKRFPRPAVWAAPGTEKAEDWFHWQNPPTRDIVRGGIGEFLGGSTDVSVFRCPSDDLETHLIRDAAGNAFYPYSYSVNFNICVWDSHPDIPGQRTLSPTQVKLSSQKILIIDESSESADDGCWAWQWDGGSSGGVLRNVLSNRHDRKKETFADPYAGSGNAGFVDGHAERIERRRTFSQKNYDPWWPEGGPLRPPTVPQPD